MLENIISDHILKENVLFLTVKLGAEIYSTDMDAHNKLWGYLCLSSAEMKQ